MMQYIGSLQSEWLKKKGSLASWIVIVGSFFTPLIIILARTIYNSNLAVTYASPNFWMLLWKNAWESMAIFLIPLGIILTTSLIAQLEYKNNTWKQLHATPLSYTTIFFSKLTIILFMLLQFFVLFNAGIYLAAVVPFLLTKGVSYPSAPLPLSFFIRQDLLYWIDCLPIVGLQYLLSLQYKNFLVSVGAGFILWITAIATLQWRYGFAVPYTYGMFNYLKLEEKTRAAVPAFNFHLLAIAYFILFIVVGYTLYARRLSESARS